MNFPWWLPAMIAAIGWGLQYSLSEPLFQKLPIVGYMAISSLATGIIFLLIWFFQPGSEKIETINALVNPKLLGLLIACIGLSLLANFAICSSVRDAGAAYSSIIEISYPLFVLIFSWMLFRIPVANLGWFLAGSAMVIGGISIIILKGRGA